MLSRAQAPPRSRRGYHSRCRSLLCWSVSTQCLGRALLGGGGEGSRSQLTDGVNINAAVLQSSTLVSFPSRSGELSLGSDRDAMW